MEAKERFQWVRKKFELSMSAFGEKIGLSASGVSAIEYGTRKMSDKHIMLICAAFPTINEHWLRTGEGDPEIEVSDGNVDAYIKSNGISDIDRAILQGLLDLKPEQKNAVIEIIKGLASSNKE